MSTRFDDASVEERLRDATRAYTDAIEPAPDAWARLRTTTDGPPARPRSWRRAVVVIAVVAAIVVVAVVATLPGVDRGGIETPARPVPTTVPTRIPDVARTHAVVVTPNTGLRDGQIVRVSGRFAPPIAAEDSIGVQMCRAGVIPPDVFTDCDPTTGQGARRVPIATMPLRRYPYLVRRTITLGGQPLDCAAPPGCVLYADNGPDRLKGPIHSRFTHTYGVAPLAFDPVAPPLPGPTVTVTPRAVGREGGAITVLTVRAQHFRPFDWSTVSVCVIGTFVCDGVGERQVQVGPTGSLSVDRSVWPVFPSADGTPQDCRSVACVVRVEVSQDHFDLPIAFAPGTPAPYPQLTLNPAGPYTDGQQVTVTLQGWPGSIGDRPALALENLALGLCVPHSPVFGVTECAGKTVLQGPDPNGRYTGTLALHRTLSLDPELGGEQIDCAQPGNCQVALALEIVGGPPSHFAVILGVDVVVT